jgi:SsrA-binding protein
MVKKKAPAEAILNRKARHDYELKKFYTAGLVLNGAEVRSLRGGHGNLRGAFVNIKDGELWLFNAVINPTNTNRNVLTTEMETQPRKLLMKRRELEELISAKDQGLTIVPIKILHRGRYIKIEIATARGFKKYDKRENIKKRDVERDINRSLKR